MTGTGDGAGAKTPDLHGSGRQRRGLEDGRLVGAMTGPDATRTGQADAAAPVVARPRPRRVDGRRRRRSRRDRPRRDRHLAPHPRLPGRGRASRSRTLLFGEPPTGKLRGTATLPPGERDGGSFPPDVLRETSFWDEAEPGTSGRVLALFGGGEPVVRSLGDDDPLADDVRAVRRWVEEGASADDVLGDLGRRAAGPVAFAAGFHLLLSPGRRRGGTFAPLPRRAAGTEGALAGVIERLRIEASAGTTWPRSARRWPTAGRTRPTRRRSPRTSPGSTCSTRPCSRRGPGCATRSPGSADRDAAASFHGPDGAAWSEEVRRRAAALRAELG